MADTPLGPLGAVIQELRHNLRTIIPLSNAAYKETMTQMKELGVPVPINYLAGAIGWLFGFAPAILGGVLGPVWLAIVSPLIVAMLRSISEFRQNTPTELTNISASVLSEFLGTEITAAHVKPGKTGDASIAAAREIGAALHKRLTAEFAPGGKVTPESGEQAARIFSGFNVNFATQNALLSMIADAESFHLLEHFRELGEEVAQNLGLGRLHRQALGPLIRNTIAEPYDRLLRSRYRQDLLDQSSYIRAYYAGRLTREQLSERLGQKGITENDIDELIQQVAPDFQQADIARLIRYGELTREQAIKLLQNQGWPADVAKARIRAVELARVDGKEAEFINVAEQQYIDGFIDDSAFEKVLSKTHLSDEEKQWERNIVGQRKDAARKRLSLSDMRRMFLDGIIDISDWDDYTESLGYSQKDRQFLLFDLLKLASDDAAKAKAAAEAAARKAAKAAGG